MTCLSALLSNTPLVRHPASVSDVACLPLVGSSIFDEIQLEQIETIVGLWRGAKLEPPVVTEPPPPQSAPFDLGEQIKKN